MTLVSSFRRRQAIFPLIVSIAFGLFIIAEFAGGSATSEAAATTYSTAAIDWNIQDHGRVRFEPDAVKPAFPAAFRLGSTTKANAMTATDVDRDGVPDLITGYSDGEAGLLAIHRGNEKSIFPTNGASPEAFFPASFIQLETEPDHIVTGDLNNDTFPDILVGETGSSRLNFLKNNGAGGFVSEIVHLPASLTALASADVNRTDGLEDVVAAVDGESGAFLLVFEGVEGAFRDPAVEVIRLPAAAKKIVTGDLDGDGSLEIAAAAGSDLVIVKGRDRQLARIDRHRASPISVKSIRASSRIHDLTFGRFSDPVRQEFVVTTEQDAFLVSNVGGDLKKSSIMKDLRMKSVTKARMSSSGSTDEIVAAKEASAAIDVYSRGLRDNKWGLLASAASNDEIVGVMPMRLNKDGLDDLVIITRNGGPIVSLSRPNAVFVVNSTGNDFDATPGNGVCLTAAGNCTLQAAIGEANASSGADEIRFNLGSGGAQSIPIDLQFLRDITETVTIDGTTQPGFAGSPIVELNGAGATINQRALRLTRSSQLFTDASNSVVRGLVINRFANSAIEIGDFNQDTTAVKVEGCFVGTNIAGTAASPNGTSGAGAIDLAGIGHEIGGTTAAARNVISGNAQSGIRIGLTDTTVGVLIRGNYIGTDKNGTADLGNGGDGIRAGNIGGMIVTVGGTAAGAGNVISGNGASGLHFSSSTGQFTALVIEGNRIGTDVTGNLDLGNDNRGIKINGYRNSRVGGTTNAARNIISGNGFDGVELKFCIRLNIQGNYIGVRSDGRTVNANGRNSIFLNNLTTDTLIGGGTPVVGPVCNAPCNVLSFGDGRKALNITNENVPDPSAPNNGLSLASAAPNGNTEYDGNGNTLTNFILALAGVVNDFVDLGNDGPTQDDPNNTNGPNNRTTRGFLSAANFTDEQTVAAFKLVQEGTATDLMTAFFIIALKKGLAPPGSSNEMGGSPSGPQTIYFYAGQVNVVPRSDRRFDYEATYPAGDPVPGDNVTTLVVNSVTGDTSENTAFLAIGPSPTPTPTPTPTPGCTISNGSLNPKKLSTGNFASPLNSFWSELQSDAGNQTQTNSNLGPSGQQGLARLADNFTLTQTCTLTAVDVYGYQTGGPATSPFAAATLRIWSGRPGDAGSTVVFGDTTTNRLSASVDTGIFRVSNTSVPAPGITPGYTRRVWKNTLAINTQLAPGTYWLDWASTIVSGGAHFYATKTVAGSRNQPGDNARVFSNASGLWQDVLDAGNPTSAPDVNLDLPFDIRGTTIASNPVTVGGRVVSPFGIAIRNAIVSLIDAQGVRRTATTSSFGVYSFDQVRTGEQYTVTATNKRFRFAPRIQQFSANVTDLDFIGLE